MKNAISILLGLINNKYLILKFLFSELEQFYSSSSSSWSSKKFFFEFAALLTKLRAQDLWKLRRAIINRPMSLQLIICRKKELLSSLFSIKLELIRKKCFQCKLVGTGTINEWYKILTIKTLTEVNLVC